MIKQLYCPFFSEIDNTGEYTVEKILTNTQDLLDLVQRLRMNQDTAWKQIAVFGDNQEVLNVIQEIVGDEFKSHLSEVTPTNSFYCLIANEWLIWFMLTEKNFFEQRPIHREHINVTLFRFLQDLSPKILLCPGNSMINTWWEKKNPFSQSAHKPKTFEIRKQELAAELQCSPILCQTAILDKELDPHYRFDLVFNENYGKSFLHILRQKYDGKEIEIQRKNYQNFLQDFTDYYRESQQSQLQKMLNKSDVQVSDQLFADILQIHKKYSKDMNKTASDLKLWLKEYVRRLHEFLETVTSGMVFKEKLFSLLKYSPDKSSGFAELTYPLIMSQSMNFDSEKITESLINFFCDSEKNETTRTKLATEIKNYNSSYSKGNLPFYLKKYRDEIKTQISHFNKELTTKFEQYWHDLERTTIIQLTPCAMNTVQSDDGKNQNISFIVVSGFKIEANKLQQLFPPLNKHEVFNTIKAMKDLKIVSCFSLRNSNSSFLCLLELTGRYTLVHLSQMGISKITEFKVKDFVFVFEPTEQEYFLINNNDHTINMGTVSDSNKLKDGQKVDLPSSVNLRSIISAIYCSKTKHLLMLTEKGLLFRFNTISHELTEQVITENKGDKINRKSLLSISQKPYNKIYSMKNENFFALRSGTEVIDIDNTNLELKLSIPLTTEFREAKIFNDRVHVYLVINNTSGLESYVFANLGSDVQVSKVEQSPTQSILGNPIIDIIRAAQIKYGPPSVFIGAPETTEFYFTRVEPFKKEFTIKFNEYVKSFPSFQSSMSIKMFELKQIVSDKVNAECVKNLDSILFSRVPLQLCTIEANNLLPLIDGTRQKLSHFSSMMSIAESATYISFGHLEKILLSLKEKKDLKVISIVGRQSSGKSYLLNRIFGTRFSVAATRCTDGIWMSYARLVRDGDGEEQFEDLVVLDCEGLFSPRRNELEETKLLTVISGISDVTILNQDLSFNRILNRLFNDLNGSVDRVKGSKYFKGFLMMAVRDVGSDDAEGSQKQTERNFQELIAKGDHKFMINLFNGKITYQSLNNFTSHELFTEEVGIMREEFTNINTKKHWKRGEEFIQNLKVILVQIYSDDGQSSDEHLKIIKSLQMENEIIAAWGKLSKVGEKAHDSHDFNFEVADEKITVSLKQSEIEFEPDLEDPSKDYFAVMEILREKFSEKIDFSKISKHEYNKFWSNFNDVLKEIVGQRLFYIEKHFEVLFEKLDTTFTPDEKNNLKIRIQKKLRAHSDDFALCLEPCTNCALRCIERKSHKDSSLSKKKQLLEDIEKAKIALDHSSPEIKKRFSEDNSYLDKIKAELKNLEEKINGCKKNISLAKEIEELSKQLDHKIKQKNDLTVNLESDKLRLDSLEIVNNPTEIKKIRQEGISDLRSILERTEKIENMFPSIQDFNQKIPEIISTKVPIPADDLPKHQAKFAGVAKALSKAKFAGVPQALRKAISEIERIKIIPEKLERKETRKKYLPLIKQIYEIYSKVSTNTHYQILQELINLEKQIAGLLGNADYQDIELKLANKKTECAEKEKSCTEAIKAAEKEKKNVNSLENQLKLKEKEINEIESHQPAISDLRKELLDREKKEGNLDQLAEKEEEIQKQIQKNKQLMGEIEKLLEFRTIIGHLRNHFETKSEGDLMSLRQIFEFFETLQPFFVQGTFIVEIKRGLEELKATLNSKMGCIEEIKSLEAGIDSLRNEQKESDTLILEEEVKKLQDLKDQNEVELKTIETLENEIVVLNQKISTILTSPKKDFPTEIQDKTTKKDTLLTKLETIDKSLISLLDESERKMKEIEQKSFSKSDFQAELESLKKELETLISNLSALASSKEIQLKLRQKIREQEQATQEKDATLESLKSECEKTGEELTKKKIELVNLQKMTEKLQKQIKYLNVDIFVIGRKVSNLIILKGGLESVETFKQLTNMEQESRQKLSMLTEKLQNDYQECNKLTSTVDEMTQKEQKLIEEITTLQNSLEPLIKQVSISSVELEGELAAMQVSYNLSLKDKMELEALRKKNLEFITKKDELKELEKSLSCFCTTDHKCEEVCYICPEKTPCKHLAGHGSEGKEKIVHICNKEQHDCGEACEILGCKNTCMYAQGHENPVYHRCSATHQCKEKCEFCLNTCVGSQASEHDKHLCSEKLCPFKCILCGAACVGTHDHDAEAIKVEDPKDPTKLVNLHLCEKEHPCPQSCDQKGVCEVHFITEKRTWEDSESIQEYEYIKPEAKIKPCMIAIPKGHYKHEGGHNCSKEHTCDNKCPECGSYCKLGIGHAGKHKALTHRNKEFCYCVTRDASKKVKVGEKGKQARVYNPGDQFTLENCSQQCTRKGRAHFHLIECKGGDDCGAKKFDDFGVKHCTDEERFHPFPEKSFDKYLCEQFWEHHGWATPHEDKTVRLCNYYCPSQDHEKEEHKHFCEELAWHSTSDSAKGHKFECHDFSKETGFIGLDLCICIDTTGSMSSYITQSKEAIKAIITNLCEKGGVSKSALRFSIVGYKDHCDPVVVNSTDFTSDAEAIKVLERFKADGGGDPPEAVFDGLYTAYNMSWKAENLKMIFHILDAPPHGKVYSTWEDDHPDGCPCGKTESIMSKIKDKGIGYYIIPLNSCLNQMINRFEKLITVNKKTLTDPVELPKVMFSTVCELIEDPELTAVINSK